jgi:hypothetical protein
MKDNESPSESIDTAQEMAETYGLYVPPLSFLFLILSIVIALISLYLHGKFLITTLILLLGLIFAFLFFAIAMFYKRQMENLRIQREILTELKKANENK